LDTQGHLVFAGAEAEFVRNMVLSRIPAVKGPDPRYLTLFLQSLCSQFANPLGFSAQIDTVGQTPLCEAIEPTLAFNMNQVSRDLLLDLGLIEECDVMGEEDAEMFDCSLKAYEAYPASPSGYRPRAPYNAAVMWMIWSLRDRLAESIMVAKILPILYQDFVANKPASLGEAEDVQFEFVATLLQVLDRRPARPDGLKLSENAFITSTTVVKREELRVRIQRIQAAVVAHNTAVEAMIADRTYPGLSKLLVPACEEGIDGLLLHCFITGVTNEVPVHLKHEIKQRLWDLGCFLKAMHDSLFPDKGKYGKLELLTRKCFMRTQYIAGDHIRDSIFFTNVSDYDLEGRDTMRLGEEIHARIADSLRATVF